jgi:hypothetical protein
MHLKLANPADAFAFATVNSGVASEPATVAVAELLRAELTARGNSTRTTLVRRVRQVVAPLLALERETVLGVCSDLERAGDVNEAPGGVLFATPLRAIRLGPIEFRIVGSMPTALLQAKLRGTWTSYGVIRNCRIDQSTDEEWRATVASEGGVIISPETWAGFETAPKADSEWLGSLDARLALPSRPGGVLQRDASLSWKALLTGEDGVRWMAGDAHGTARLWRAWNEYGYWVFAWTEGGHPSTNACQPLTNDEAARSLFAVAQTSDSPVVLEVRQQDGASELTMAHWLPRAEYRYLSVFAAARSRKGSETTWSVPDDQLSNTMSVLRERLGVSFR